MAKRSKAAQFLVRQTAGRALNILIPFRQEAQRLKQRADTLTQENARLRQEKTGQIETFRARRRRVDELGRIAEFLYDRLRQHGGIESDADTRVWPAGQN